MRRTDPHAARTRMIDAAYPVPIVPGRDEPWPEEVKLAPARYPSIFERMLTMTRDAAVIVFLVMLIVAMSELLPILADRLSR